MSRSLALLAVLLLGLAGPAAAQKVGAGYNPFPGEPDPWATGVFDPDAFVDRYNYSADQWWKMPGMIAELYYVNAIALRNACLAGALADPGTYNCQPTPVEQQDLTATVHRPAKQDFPEPVPGNFYCRWWFAYVFEGGQASNPIHVSRSDRPAGAFTEATNPFWSCPVHYFNLPAEPEPEPTCVQTANRACLRGARFAVEATYRTGQGQSGNAYVVPLTTDTAYLWFFEATNVEAVVKVLDACNYNQRYWVFASGLTDVEVVVKVTDTKTDTLRTYTNPLGKKYEAVQDTDAFPTCQAP
ncbi:MAG TPA: hypothetical protein VF121_16545 [Thermoanaerobaculia bacterium]|nr:hypothetical protein [Thermoanaerobaculia bacterium]